MTSKERADMLWEIIYGYATVQLENDTYAEGFYVGQWTIASKMLNIRVTDPWYSLFLCAVTGKDYHQIECQLRAIRGE